MFDIGWSEMLVVGVVALIVVGPKDLPKMFHTLGQVTGKARGMAREFQRAMDDAAKEAGVRDIVKDFKRTTSGQGLKEAAGLDDIEKEFRDIGHDRSATPSSKPGVGTKGKPAMPPATEAGPKEVSPVSIDDVAEEEDDEIAAQDLARHNAEASATEAARLKKVEKAAKARQQAAVIRAKREAAAAEQKPEPRPETRPEPSSAAPQPEADS